jgi:uncharacterized protein
MHFNVSQLLREPSGARRSYTVDEAIAVTDGANAGAWGQVTLLRTHRGVWVTAVLESKIVLSCSRCLTDHEQPVQIALDEEFFPTSESSSRAKPAERFPAGEQHRIDDNHILDLSDAVGQYYALGVPLQPVCREACAGLCLTCGANLNETHCRCESSARDPRWDALLGMALLSDGDS